MGFGATLLQSLGTALGIMFGGLFLMTIVMIVWVRAMVKGKMYVYILEPNKQITTMLTRVTSDKIDLGKGDDAQTYVISPRKMFWMMWPPGFPDFVRSPVPASVYVRNVPEPIDPYEQDSMVTGSSLKIIRDEAMLRTLWRDLREQLGVKTYRPDMLTLVLSGIAAAMSAGAFYLVFKLSDDVSRIIQILGG